MSNDVRFEPDLACNRCSRFGAFRFDGENLCGECYETRGSCCPEFGGDDRCETGDAAERLVDQAEPTSPLTTPSSLNR